LFCTDDKKCNYGSEEPNDSNDDPSKALVEYKSDSGADGLAAPEPGKSDRVFDRIMKPVNRGERGVPYAESVSSNVDVSVCGISIEIHELCIVSRYGPLLRNPTAEVPCKCW
jgi:hypothetical protein